MYNLLPFNSKEESNHIKRPAQDRSKCLSKEDPQTANTHIKRWLKSLFIRELQIKTLRYHLTPTRRDTIQEKTGVVEDAEERASLPTAGGNTAGTAAWNAVWQVFRKSHTGLPRDSALRSQVPSKRNKRVYTNPSVWMFTAASFIAARTRYQPKCPPTDGRG